MAETRQPDGSPKFVEREASISSFEKQRRFLRSRARMLWNKVRSSSLSRCHVSILLCAYICPLRPVPLRLRRIIEAQAGSISLQRNSKTQAPMRFHVNGGGTNHEALSSMKMPVLTLQKYMASYSNGGSHRCAHCGAARSKGNVANRRQLENKESRWRVGAGDRTHGDSRQISCMSGSN